MLRAKKVCVGPFVPCLHLPVNPMYNYLASTYPLKRTRVPLGEAYGPLRRSCNLMKRDERWLITRVGSRSAPDGSR